MTTIPLSHRRRSPPNNAAKCTSTTLSKP
jgi:hypothetical protein